MESGIVKQGNYKGYHWLIKKMTFHSENKDENDVFDKLGDVYGLGSIFKVGYYRGYVDLPKTDKYYGYGYDDIPIECHGGLTYSEDGRIGFDCAHFEDYVSPKNIGFVQSECQSIIDQLRKLNHGE